MEFYKKIRLKELKNKEFFEENPDYTMDYPHLDDPQLQRKLSIKKEFRLYKYDGTIEDIETKAKALIMEAAKAEETRAAAKASALAKLAALGLTPEEIAAL